MIAVAAMLLLAPLIAGRRVLLSSAAVAPLAFAPFKALVLFLIFIEPAETLVSGEELDVNKIDQCEKRCAVEQDIE